MEEGRIEQIDAPQSIYRRPATPFVARFLGFRNLLPGRVRGEHLVETALGKLRVANNSGLPPPDTAVTLLIRPDAADPCRPPQEEDNELRGRIAGVAFRGRFCQVWVDVAGETLLFEVTAVDGWEEGREATLRLSPAHLAALEERET
jgi:ABC-type Fe3+/spermidine/putrescine transport system ATPase subunit